MVALTNAPTLIPEKRPSVEGGGRFRVVSGFEPAGDQPDARRSSLMWAMFIRSIS